MSVITSHCENHTRLTLHFLIHFGTVTHGILHNTKMSLDERFDAKLFKTTLLIQKKHL